MPTKLISNSCTFDLKFSQQTLHTSIHDKLDSFSSIDWNNCHLRIPHIVMRIQYDDVWTRDDVNTAPQHIATDDALIVVKSMLTPLLNQCVTLEWVVLSTGPMPEYVLRWLLDLSSCSSLQNLVLDSVCVCESFLDLFFSRMTSVSSIALRSVSFDGVNVYELFARLSTLSIVSVESLDLTEVSMYQLLMSHEALQLLAIKDCFGVAIDHIHEALCWYQHRVQSGNVTTFQLILCDCLDTDRDISELSRSADLPSGFVLTNQDSELESVYYDEEKFFVCDRADLHFGLFSSLIDPETPHSGRDNGRMSFVMDYFGPDDSDGMLLSSPKCLLSPRRKNNKPANRQYFA